MYVLITILIGYLFGCIHGSQIIGNYKSVNIKGTGMKNAGATNATLLLGWRYGLFVAFIDVFKAVLSILLIIFILNKNGIINEAQTLFIYINMVFVIIGHNYPITMKFNGGKGTASFIGSLLVMDWRIAIMGITILLVIAVATDYFVVGTFFMYVSFLAYTQFTFGVTTLFVAFIIFLLFIVKHVENYKRISKGEETRLSILRRKEAR
ncbi:MAG TPA: glycerol-3-phosphate acyltransferase [Virgibacillus sp.]|nr:glycerol-3-phosphate acyltransferase [Virgibacillus sp.]